MITRRSGAHLDHRAADLVAGRLSPVDAEHARQHLHGCAGCAELVRQQQLVRDRLRHATGPAPATELLAGLLSMTSDTGPAGPHPAVLRQTGMPAPGMAAPDASRWVFAAALVGGMSLVAIGTTAHVPTPNRTEPPQRPLTVVASHSSAATSVANPAALSGTLVPMPQTVLRGTSALWPLLGGNVGQNRETTAP